MGVDSLRERSEMRGGEKIMASEQTQNRWLPVVGGLSMSMALGMFYGISVFLLPLEKEFGWTRAQTSWVTTFGAIMIALWFLVGGAILDRKGPRIVAVAGSIFFSLSFLLASYVHSLLMFYLSIGVCLGIGVGFGYAVPMTVGAKWFPDKRGLVVGFMVAGSGLGSGIFGPLASSMIEHQGWRSTVQVLSAVFFVMTMGGAILLKAPLPGYRPAGWTPPQSSASPAGSDVPTSQMLRTSTFWVLWFAYGLGATSGLMVISQLVPFARSSGHSAAVAALAISIGALGNTIGRVLSGWVSDHLGRLNMLRIALFISGIAMPLLFLSRRDVVLFYIALSVVYYCYGAQFSVYPSLSADFYGTKNMGLNYGLLLLAWGAAGVLGPFLGGRAYVATGSYQWAFYIAAALSFVAVAVLFAAKTPEGAGTGHSGH
jgi:OFA family oxalate/formate antiporter-like MFS transporter